jgi:hypothetical protein
MQTAGARVLQEDDNGMSREAVLLQWERKIEAAERRDSGRFERPGEGEPLTEAVPLRPTEDSTTPARRRFERRPTAEAALARRADAERRTGSDAERRTGSDAERRTGSDAERRTGSDAEHRTGSDAERPTRAETEHGPREPERRTVTITGQPTPERRRYSMIDAQLAQPDRIALWAFLLGLLLVVVAAGTAHA